MIPSHLKLNNSLSVPTEPAPQPSQTPTPESVQKIPEAISPLTDPDFAQEFIISEDDLYKQYEGDTKIAADATIDEDTGAISINPTPVDNTPKPPLTDAEAQQNTEMFMHLREGAQSAALAYFVDGKLSESEKYNYPEPQFKKLVSAWAPMIQRTGIRLSPWWNILMAEITCTGPLVMVAIEAHKLRKTVENLQARNRANEEKIRRFEQQESFEKPTRSATNQKKWEIDNDGYFKYTAAGGYLKPPMRSEKPNLKTDYDLLCKHNGKEFVDKIFKITV